MEECLIQLSLTDSSTPAASSLTSLKIHINFPGYAMRGEIPKRGSPLPGSEPGKPQGRWREALTEGSGTAQDITEAHEPVVGRPVSEG